MRAGDEPMMQARRWILSHGGIAKSGTLARFYLACMDQVPWDATASLPVEITLLPELVPGQYVRALVMGARHRVRPDAAAGRQAGRPVDYRDGVLELYIQPPHFTKFQRSRRPPKLFSLRNAFNLADKVLRMLRSSSPLRRCARGRCAARRSWILEHQEANGSWGGIQPCYLLSPMALKALGYRNDHPVIGKALEATRELIWDHGDATLYMPCVSPNWDTALAAKALLDSGLGGDHPALKKAAQMVHRSSDFQERRLVGEAARIWSPADGRSSSTTTGYPDVDDSAVILMVLAARAVDDAAGERARDSRRRELGDGDAIEGRRLRGLRRRLTIRNGSTKSPLADVEAATDPVVPI